MYYKNCSNVKRKFFGVYFEPGETKYVPGIINIPGFIKVSKPKNMKSTSDEKPKRKQNRKKSVEHSEVVDSEFNNDVLSDGIDVDLSDKDEIVVEDV